MAAILVQLNKRTTAIFDDISMQKLFNDLMEAILD